MINPDFIIDTALNGQIALEKITLPTNYDFIFLDLNMPVMDGFQVTMFALIFLQAAKCIREMEQDFLDTKVVALSAITANQFYCNTE